MDLASAARPDKGRQASAAAHRRGNGFKICIGVFYGKIRLEAIFKWRVRTGGARLKGLLPETLSGPEMVKKPPLPDALLPRRRGSRFEGAFSTNMALHGAVP
jgi:hypothetical protein